MTTDKHTHVLLTLTIRERSVAAYALAYYAAALDSSGADIGYTGSLETAPEVRAIEDRLRRAPSATADTATS